MLLPSKVLLRVPMSPHGVPMSPTISQLVLLPYRALQLVPPSPDCPHLCCFPTELCCISVSPWDVSSHVTTLRALCSVPVSPRMSPAVLLPEKPHCVSPG